MSVSTPVLAIWGGTEDMTYWDGENCDTCVKEGPACPLWLAITEAAYGQNDGALAPEIVARLGWGPHLWGALDWPCPERQREDDPPKPAAVVMAEAGAPQLPGFDALMPETPRYPR